MRLPVTAGANEFFQELPHHHRLNNTQRRERDNLTSSLKGADRYTGAHSRQTRKNAKLRLSLAPGDKTFTSMALLDVSESLELKFGQRHALIRGPDEQ